MLIGKPILPCRGLAAIRRSGRFKYIGNCTSPRERTSHASSTLQEKPKGVFMESFIRRVTGHREKEKTFIRPSLLVVGTSAGFRLGALRRETFVSISI